MTDTSRGTLPEYRISKFWNVRTDEWAYRWELRNAEGDIIARSPMGDEPPYTEVHLARQGVEDFRAVACDAPLYVGVLEDPPAPH